MTDAPAFLTDAVQQKPAADDRLTKLRTAIAAVRDLEAEKRDLEERLKTVNKTIYSATHGALPELMDEVSVNSLTLAAEGNHPAVLAEAKPYFEANIAAAWEPERRQAAFAYLTNIGHGDLIKTQVTVAFNREDREAAVAFADKAQAAGLFVEIKESVHAQTLTAWLKEQVTRHKAVPALDLIGGVLGRVVKLKPLKED